MNAIEDVWFTGATRRREALSEGAAQARSGTVAPVVTNPPAPVPLTVSLSYEEAIAFRAFLSSLIKMRPMAQIERRVCNRVIDTLDACAAVKA